MTIKAGSPVALPRRVTRGHVRALATSGRRSALVLTGGRLAVIDPDAVLDLAAAAGCRVLVTRADLADTVAALRLRHPDRRNLLTAATAVLARDLTAMLGEPVDERPASG